MHLNGMIEAPCCRPEPRRDRKARSHQNSAIGAGSLAGGYFSAIWREWRSYKPPRL